MHVQQCPLEGTFPSTGCVPHPLRTSLWKGALNVRLGLKDTLTGPSKARPAETLQTSPRGLTHVRAVDPNNVPVGLH